MSTLSSETNDFQNLGQKVTKNISNTEKFSYRQTRMTENRPPPCAPPLPDHQGEYENCADPAMSKAVTGGLFYGKFTNQVSVDVSQEAVTSTLVQETKNVDAKHPTVYHDKTIFVQEKNYPRTTWELTLKVDDVTANKDTELSHENLWSSEYLLVYPYSEDPAVDHCVYVKRIDENDRIECINSHGVSRDVSYPIIKREDIVTLYRVTFDAKKIPFPPTRQPLGDTLNLPG